MIDYFVIGHESVGCSEILKQNFTFLRVGLKNIQTTHLNTIRCIDLEDNIEQYPYLCSFTGWYALSKNKLYTNRYVCILEYDTLIKTTLHTTNNKILTDNSYTVIGYSRTQLDHYVFTKSTPWLEISLKQIYNIDLKQFIKDYGDKFRFWPTTTNITMSTNTLDAFVDWFEPMTKLFRNHRLGAYVHERAFFIFCVINNIDITYALNEIQHHQQQSHNISDIYGSVLRQYNTYYLADNMISTYNQLYNYELNKAIKILQETNYHGI